MTILARDPSSEEVKSTVMPSNIDSNEEILVDEELSLFQEPEDFRPKTPPPTFTTFDRTPEDVQGGTPSQFQLRLISPHSLWGHMLWNAGIVLTRHLDHNKQLCHGKTVLELGAAAALPSFVSAINGCKLAVITDYPEKNLIENMDYNVRVNLPELLDSGVIKIMGHLWGDDVSPILNELVPFNTSKFDVVILADVIFNHSQHIALLKSVKATLAEGTGIVYVPFSHHRPDLAHKDMAFFELAQADPFNFKVEKMFEERLKPMFEVDRGPAEIRATVHVYALRI
ncbi:hypothetical protein SmJEL517_g06176 [Synchytrium microbalum]|uniref:Elongation factor methyltransferase 7 n=1 Tax=Synchytrium microbalum TaxID=1806994 RepID=A0A507BS47_9FUNG|nr:uncharacterized protein SmJEL517_g06176 [Synchytrium microbalum]TPX30211.1 hypothetical protein SmJEL517_g06176 [Synchytrium microbalum]